MSDIERLNKRVNALSRLCSDLQRRLANTSRIGTISKVDHKKGLYKVAIGDLETDWRPYSGTRAGTLKIWSPLTKGEQVMLQSPSGDLSQAIITGSLASDAHPSPGNDGNTINIEFPDGSKLAFGQGVFSFETSADVTIKAGTVSIEAGAIGLKGPVTQTGGDMTSNGISAQTHTHGGITKGDKFTEKPL